MFSFKLDSLKFDILFINFNFTKQVMTDCKRRLLTASNTAQEKQEVRLLESLKLLRVTL